MKRFFKDKRTRVSIAIVLLILLDQFIKYIITTNLRAFESIVVIKDVLRITFIYNNGAAFGLFSGHGIILVLINLVVVLVLLFYIYQKKIILYKYLIPSSMIIAGGCGNLIDRIFRGQVIDYIDLRFWPFNNFAVFNLSDFVVVTGSLLLILVFIIDSFKKNKIEKTLSNE